MRSPRVLPVLLCLASCVAFGQAGTPDCQFTATFSTATAGTAFSNRTTPCVEWRVTYYTGGASGVSIKIEGAADSAGAPTGSYTALTATQGSANPATGTAEGTIAACCDYYPWIRVNPTTFTGTSQTMTVRVYGWKAPDTGPYSSSGASGTQNVNVLQWGSATTTLGQKLMAASVPAVLASDQSAIAGNITQWAGSSVYPCLSQASFNLSGSGNTQIIALSGSTTIRICHISFSTVAPEDVKITRGTGSNCGTGGADVTGLYKSIQGLALDFSSLSPLTGAASGAICINQSVAQALGGIVLYDQR